MKTTSTTRGERERRRAPRRSPSASRVRRAAAHEREDRPDRDVVERAVARAAGDASGVDERRRRRRSPQRAPGRAAPSRARARGTRPRRARRASRRSAASLPTASTNRSSTSSIGCQSAAVGGQRRRRRSPRTSTAICAARMSPLRLDTTLRSSAGRPSDLTRLAGTAAWTFVRSGGFSWRTTIAGVRGRLAPLAVRPFSRLLSSYTLNELGDSVGHRRAGRARLRPDAGRRADRGVLHRGQVPARAAGAGADGAARPGRAAAQPAGALRASRRSRSRRSR